MLKKKMIFNLKDSGYSFTRDIRFDEENIFIEDKIAGAGIEEADIYRAPHYSLRHVSSAGQFMAEELLRLPDEKGKMEKNQRSFYREIKISGNE
jgi:hypothetical protein